MDSDIICPNLRSASTPCNMSNYARAPKKTTSVSVAEALLAEAKVLGINVSQAAEEGLAKAVSTKRAEQWIQENWDAIQSSNEYVEKHGLPLAKYRMF
jgi:antitoxin CcdA